MRFSLLDRITSLESGQSIVATKSLSLAEEYLADHFPGFPVEPGVLMLESMVQASAWLMRHTHDFAYSVVMLKEAKAVKFNSFLTPGKTLEVRSSVHRSGVQEYTMKASGTVEGESTVSARLIMQQFNLADTSSEMQESDERLKNAMRDLFNQLWVAGGATSQS